MRIAAYTIALNEAKHVARWYASSKDADYHLIADTGSTDDTVKIAQELGINVIHVRSVPFRFDDARNASLMALPDDIDYCIALDMDEVLCEGWRAELEKAYADNISRPAYRFITDWTEDGQQAVEFDGFRIHKRKGIRWIYPIHEVPTEYDDQPRTSKKYNFEVHHLPDKTKSRGQYLSQLEQAAKEDKGARTLYYLGREYFYRKMFIESAKTLKEYLEVSNFPAEKGYAMRILSKCEPEQAEEWLMKSVEAYESRESLLALANHYYLSKEWEECILVCKEALKFTEKPTHFISENWAWGHMADDLLAVCSWQVGDFKTAYKHGKIAAEMTPSDERLQTNLEFYKSKIGKKKAKGK